MRRRDFIAGLGSAAAWPFAARAQQQRIPTVGFLHAGSRQVNDEPPFRKGLSEMGFVEGRNVTIEYHYSEDQYDRLPALAAELVRRRAAVILAGGGDVAASAAKAATTTIPIVFVTGGDPVEAGLVTSFNRPGGNVTGMSFMNGQLMPKRLGLLHMLLPAAARFAMLVNPGYSPGEASLIRDVQAAASTVGGQVNIFTASSNDEIDSAFASMMQWRAEALVIGTSPFFGRQTRQLATLTVRHALPAIGSLRPFVEAGGLMSYGSSLADTYRQAGIYVGRILKGEKPTELPVMQPTKFELMINLATAKTIGIEVPPTLLAIADEVIE